MDDDLNNVDLSALAVAVALQREELEDEEDYEVRLLRSQLDDIAHAIQQHNDANMARSISVANVTNAAAIEEARQENEEDEEHIEDLEDAELMMNQARPKTNDLRTLSKLAGKYVSREAGQILLAQEETGVAETWRYADQVVQEAVPKTDCVICGDEKEYYEVMDMPCRHSYCQDCIQELFMASFKDESLFPPRCCRQPLIEEKIEIFLTREIRETFQEKQVEFSTTDRTYCFYKSCSAFIPPAKCNARKGYARCQKCPRLTCLMCKQRHHGATDCPENPEQQEILALAQDAGWQRCERCHNMVELNTGCNHMTCKCGHEFCYVCGAAPWKSCDCPHWDEELLLDRAHQVAARERRDVRQVREELINRHDCNHERWRSCRGGRCDECGQHLPNWLNRCQQCRVQFCRRFRLNRAR